MLSNSDALVGLLLVAGSLGCAGWARRVDVPSIDAPPSGRIAVGIEESLSRLVNGTGIELSSTTSYKFRT